MVFVAIKARYLTKGLVMASPVAVLEAISNHHRMRHFLFECDVYFTKERFKSSAMTSDIGIWPRAVDRSRPSHIPYHCYTYTRSMA